MSEQSVEREGLLYKARRLRMRHNDNFYGPMKGATCGCDVCKWLVAFIDSAARVEQLTRERKETLLKKSALALKLVDERERAGQAEAELTLLRERITTFVQSCGVDDIDPRLDYIYLQIGREDWAALTESGGEVPGAADN
jgi:hypothetical protein